MYDLGTRIKEAREKRGLSQRERKCSITTRLAFDFVL